MLEQVDTRGGKTLGGGGGVGGAGDVAAQR